MVKKMTKGKGKSQKNAKGKAKKVTKRGGAKRKAVAKPKAKPKKAVISKVAPKAVAKDKKVKVEAPKAVKTSQTKATVAKKMENKNIILSVVIPAYKEEKRIGNTLIALDKYLSPLGFAYEIIVIIDGSPDNTFQVVDGYRKMVKNLVIINNPENHGKGYVVRQGLLAAKGAYRLFMDADNSTSIDQIEKFSPCFEDRRVGIVIGSRDMAESQVKKSQPAWKVFLGDMGNLMIQFVGGLWGIKDTQCGFKVLTGELADKICPAMMINRWGFDIEMLVLAKKAGYKIKQVPVVWVNDEASTVTIGGYFNTLKELFLVRWNVMTGKYKI